MGNVINTAVVLSGATSSAFGDEIVPGGDLFVLSGAHVIATVDEAPDGSGPPSLIIDKGSASGSIISSGAQESVISGIESGGTVSAGGSLNLGIAGTSLAETLVGSSILSSGLLNTNQAGVENIGSGGTAIGTTISAGGAELVHAGGTSISANSERQGGVLVVDTGGVASDSIISNAGVDVVSGTDLSANIGSAGTMGVFDGGSSISAKLTGIEAAGLDLATQVVFSGGVTEHTSLGFGGNEIVTSDGTAISTIVGYHAQAPLNDGGLILSGASGFVLNAGFAAGGGTASDTIIESTGREAVFSGGFDISATVQSGGTEFVFSGGSAFRPDVELGGELDIGIDPNLDFQFVSAPGGGVVSSATINLDARDFVWSGGSDVDPTVKGTVVVDSGGLELDPTLSAGGSITVSSGGTLQFTGSNTAIGESNQYQVFGGATLAFGAGAVDSSNPGAEGVFLDLLSGGTSLHLDLGPEDTEFINAGGTASGGFAAGAFIDVAGVDSGGVIGTNAFEIIESGGTGINPEIAGGVLQVQSGGDLSGVFLQAGNVGLAVGADVHAVAFGSGQGLLAINGSSSVLSNFMAGLVVNGLAAGDIISLPNVAFSANASASASNGFLDITVGGTTYALGLGTSNSIASGFQITSAGSGIFVTVSGTPGSFGIVVSSANSPHNVSSGSTESGDRVVAGGSMFVLSGGTANTTSVDSGGFLTISRGGTGIGTVLGFSATAGGSETVDGFELGATIGSGGVLVVSSGGIANATFVQSGGTEIVRAGGTGLGAGLSGSEASSATFPVELVSSGGRASATTIASGGLLVISAGGLAVDAGVSNTGVGFSAGGIAVSGIASNTLIGSDGQEGVFAHGTDLNAEVKSGGDLFINSGGTGIAATLAGEATTGSYAVEFVSSGGRTSRTQIFSGGVDFVSAGALAVSTIVNSTGFGSGAGGLVLSGGTASGTVVGGQEAVFTGGSDIAGNVVAGGGEFVFTGGLARATNVDGGDLDVGFFNSTISSGGGTSLDAALASGGVLNVFSAGIAESATIGAGGSAFAFSGGIFAGVVVKSGGFAAVESGAGSATLTISSGGVFELAGANGASVKLMVHSGGTGELGSGAVAPLEGVGAGVTAIILSGGTATGGAVSAGGLVVLQSGGVVSSSSSSSSSGNLVVSSGGTFEFAGLDADSASQNITALSGANFALAAGGFYSGQVTSGIRLLLLAGGSAEGVTILGGGSEVVSAGSVESRGTVATGGKLFVTSGGSAVDDAVAAGGSAVVSKGGALAVATSAMDLGTLTDSGVVLIESGGTLSLGGTATIGTGALFDVAADGNVVLTGKVTNSGTLFADGSGSLLRITSGAVITGGSAEIGNGTLDIQGPSSENVAFQPSGSGVLQLDDPLTYTGKVSGFGSAGAAHEDKNEKIDLSSVAFVSGVTVATYAGNAGGGVLTVTSGGSTMAKIDFVGPYQTSDFALSSSGGGTVITDPAPLPNANVALLTNYMAASFVTPVDQGGNMRSETSATTHPLLSTPLHG